MHNKKRIITKPFDRKKTPPKQNIFLMPLIWIVCHFQTKKYKLKIKKVNTKGLKPPFLLLGTHHSFMDFYVTPLTIFPYRANYISELEGFENYGEWIYRQAGCLGTRKYVNDQSLIKNIKKVVDRGDIIVIYPEARYANVGTSSKLPQSVGKLAKFLNVPVVTLNMKGNYLQSPIWNLTPRKEAKIEATITQIYSKEELQKANINEINKKIETYLKYDEYKWQYENKLAITYNKRAEGLELPLYQCRNCKQEFFMNTKNDEIFCNHCHTKWHMTEYGRLENKNGSIHIPDWYEWERKNVIYEIDNDLYNLDIEVEVESLPNGVNFINLGKGRLKHNKNGFSLIFKEYLSKKNKELSFSPATMTSVHTEYNYRNKGQCITLSTQDNTYFLFPKEEGFNCTKIQFATEYLYEKSKKNIEKRF